jgi:putative spermidine/putrescine transport system permease protein
MTALRSGPLALALAALVALFLLLPLVAVVPVSFTPARFLSMPKGEWSLVHYRALLDNPDWMRSVLLSLKIGVVASLAATALGTLFALGIWMARPWFAGLLVGFVALPMIVPPVVSAMSLYFLLTGLSQVNDAIGYDSWGGVALAHVVMIVPFAVVIVLVALAGVDRRIDLAARSLRASLSTRIVSVILPNIRSASCSRRCFPSCCPGRRSASRSSSPASTRSPCRG